MERKSKADIKKALEQLKSPKGQENKAVAASSGKQNAKAMNSSSGSKTYRPKI